MNKKRGLTTLSIIVVLVILLQNNVNPIMAYGRFPRQTYDEGFVYEIRNDKFTSYNTDFLAIDIVELRHDISHSLIALELFEKPNISSSYEYWILLAWTDNAPLRFHDDWQDPNWEEIDSYNINLTVCVAGGAQWFNLVNGSYSAIYNSNNELIYTEFNNNSVNIVDDSILTFPFDSSSLDNPGFVYNDLVYTMYNATTSPTESLFYIDAMPNRVIDEVFGLQPSIPLPSDVLIFPIIILSLVILSKRKKT